jgi:hypothetical protein
MLNEIAYRFTLNFTINYIADPNINFLAAQVNTANALDFATINMKFYYNCCYTPMFLALSN